MKEKIQKYIIAFFCCCVLIVNAQTEDTSYINRLNERSFNLVKKYPDSAVILAQQAIVFSEKLNYFPGLGDGFIRLGLVEKDKGNYDEALALYRKSLFFRIKAGNEDLIARVYNNMGMVFTWQAQYDSAFHYLVLALKIAEKMQLNSYQAIYLMNLGIAHENNRDYKKAIFYGQKAKTLYTKASDSTGILKTNVNLGSAFCSFGDWDSSLLYSREAIHLATLLDDDFNLFKAMGNMAAAFQETNQFDSALYYLRYSLEYNTGIEDKRGVSLDMNNMGNVYKSLGKSDSAIYYLKESLKMAEEMGEINLASRNAEMLAQIFSNKGDFKNAFGFQQKFSVYSDSVFNESKEKAIADMQTKYETDKKEQEIQLLNKDNKIKTLVIKKQEVLRNALIGGAVLIVIIGLLLFNRYRISQKHKKQAERMRISSDLHDEVGSTLSSIGLYSSFAEQKLNEQNPGEVKLILEEISLSARQMNEDMNDIVWALNPNNDSLSHTIDRLHNYSARMTSSKNIILRFSENDSQKNIPLTMDQRKNFYLICKEGINNAVKYAECKHLDVDIHVRKNNVYASIADDGKGFDMLASFDGNGLKNMAYRAEQIKAVFSMNSVLNKGTSFSVEVKII